MSRSDILQVRLPVDELGTLKRRALAMGLQPASYARILLLAALGGRTALEQLKAKPRAKR